MLALNKKNIITKILIILFILINTFTISSLAVVSPTADFYVNDYAGLLDKETENYIINANKSLYSQTGAQIVVVTIPSLGSSSLEDYATELFRSFGIGDKTKNNGLLLLLALEERQFRVEVGYGLEGILPDAKTGRIQDEYIIPYLKQNNWNDGIKNGFSAFLEIVASEYNAEIEIETPVMNTNAQSNVLILLAVLVGLPFLSGYLGMLLGSLKQKKIINNIMVIIISILFIGFISVVSFYFFKNISSLIVWSIFNLLCFLPTLIGFSTDKLR